MLLFEAHKFYRGIIYCVLPGVANNLRVTQQICHLVYFKQQKYMDRDKSQDDST